MRIMHVEAGRHLYGGAQQVKYLLAGLAARDIDNLLVCPTGSAIEKTPPAGARVEALPMSGDLDFKLIPRLRRLIRREHPDVVHLHSRRGADLLGALAAWRVGVKVVLSRRVDNPEAALWAALKYRLYDRVITISEAIARILRAEGVPDEKITCVPSAVEPEIWESPETRARLVDEFSLRADAPLIGMAAQFIARKGHAVLLAALPAVIERFPNAQVVLFGKGREQEKVQHEVQARGLAHNVFFAGFRNDLHRWLGALDMLVHPALNEGLGVALLQAASARLPIVACDAGGMGEVIVDGQTGLLVPAGDAQALGAAMCSLLADRALAARLGQAAGRRVATQFSVAAMTEGNLAVYRELLQTTEKNV